MIPAPDFLLCYSDVLKSSTTLALSAEGGAKPLAAAEPSALKNTIQIAVYFALWYLFNIGYNIYNKQALNALDYPWTIAFLQMAAGIAYFLPLWVLGLRKAPKLSADDLKTLFPIALCHTGVHIGAVIALGAGAVSFAHIVKASEPVVTCGMNAAILGEVLPLPVYLTLLPIIGGVAIASMKELSFTVLALASAMLSNVSSAARGVLSKKTMSGKKIGENLDAQNLYAVLTAMSTLILLPLAYAFEGTSFLGAFNAAVKSGEFTKKSLATLIALSGATYYAYNEVAFLALGKVRSFGACVSCLDCICMSVSHIFSSSSYCVTVGQSCDARRRKHHQTCCDYCCVRGCIQDPNEHGINHWLVHCHLWHPALLARDERHEEISIGMRVKRETNLLCSPANARTANDQ